MNQGPPPPFDPRTAVKKFADILKEYRVTNVTGDAFAGETFRVDFAKEGIEYRVSELTKSELYEALEPRMNSGDVVLLDNPTMESQLLGLVWRGSRIDHPPAEHDDFANAAAGAVHAAINTCTKIEILTCGPPQTEEQREFYEIISKYEWRQKQW